MKILEIYNSEVLPVYFVLFFLRLSLYGWKDKPNFILKK